MICWHEAGLYCIKGSVLHVLARNKYSAVRLIGTHLRTVNTTSFGTCVWGQHAYMTFAGLVAGHDISYEACDMGRFFCFVKGD